MKHASIAAVLTPLWISLLLCTLPASSAEPTKKKLIATDTLGVDADFYAQGEYSGSVTVNNTKQRVALQVIALGNSRFSGVGYWGGLPGDGWDGNEKLRFTGATKEGTTFLTNSTEPKKLDRDLIVVSGKIGFGELKLFGPQSKPIGVLPRVKRRSPTLGKKPPAGAIVLFDGTTAKAFEKGRMTSNGLLQEGTQSRQLFQNHDVHIEFQLPYMPSDRGQGRGNSGCYLQGRYEIQVLDSFGLDGKNNECGGIYSVRDPNVNMCLPPLAWQTYDIKFTAAKYDAAGKKLGNARMTVHHNGVLVHKEVEIPHRTTAAPLKEGATPGPLFLQDHDCPLRYRNIWVVPRSE
ncbi:MAG: DUF1080 domain-containing protein [Planctomycetes bacterium]|nr:DUF1080 domain-containing protein [Planctomycetota bacterium]